MEKDRLKLQSQTVDNYEWGSCKVAESYDEASGAGISKDLIYSTYNLRRSSRLKSKDRETSRSRDNVKSDKNCFKCKMESPKAGFDRNTLVFESKVGVNNMHQLQHRNVNDGAFPVEIAFTSSSMKSSTSVPSFEFHVRSEEGIKLFVDLNSSQSDWLRSMENEVCVCQKLQTPQFQSFRQELEYLGDNNNLIGTFVKNIADIGMNNDLVHAVSSPNSMKRENGNTGFDKPEEGDGSLEIYMTKPSSATLEVSLQSEVENKVPISSTSIISSPKSCPRDGDIKTMDSVVLDAPQFKPSSFVNLTLRGSESSHAEEVQNSKLVIENCGNAAPEDIYSLENHIADYTGYKTFGCNEIRLSEFASHLKDSSCSVNICSQNLFDTVQNAETENNRSTITNEVNQETSADHTPASVEERHIRDEASAIEEHVTNGQLENRSVKSVSDGGTKIKRHNCGSDPSCGQHDGRILRSTKRLDVQVPFEHGGQVLR